MDAKWTRALGAKPTPGKPRCQLCDERDATRGGDPFLPRLVFCDECRERFGPAEISSDERVAVAVASLHGVPVVKLLLEAARAAKSEADRKGVIAPTGTPKKLVRKLKAEDRDAAMMREKTLGATFAAQAEKLGTSPEALRMRAMRRRNRAKKT